MPNKQSWPLFDVAEKFLIDLKHDRELRGEPAPLESKAKTQAWIGVGAAAALVGTLAFAQRSGQPFEWKKLFKKIA